jgi:hypothetical protein
MAHDSKFYFREKYKITCKYIFHHWKFILRQIKNNYLTLRSKVKVLQRSLRYATHRLLVMYPHTKYHWPIWKDENMTFVGPWPLTSRSNNCFLRGDISFRYLKQLFLVIYKLKYLGRVRARCDPPGFTPVIYRYLKPWYTEKA